MSTARFEVVHTGPHKFHARFVAANGEAVWVTESYRTRRAAHEAIVLLTWNMGSWGDVPATVEVDER